MKKFVIVAPHYDERSGGRLILHYLCHYLNECGYPAFFWHMDWSISKGADVGSEISYHLQMLKQIRQSKNLVSPDLNTPVYTSKDFEDAIVVYPEIINGNFLEAPHVVRWFLNKPGHFRGHADYGKDDLFFHFQESFKDTRFPSKYFQFFVSLREFQRTNYGPRDGVCYILRKGKDRPKQHNLENGVIVDTLSHKEMSEVFNRCEYCISYDMHTAYSNYAASCGCKSIVVPDPDIDAPPELQWRYGLAYGEENIDWAEKTLPDMEKKLAEDEQETKERVDWFAKQCLSYFSTEP